MGEMNRTTPVSHEDGIKRKASDLRKDGNPKKTHHGSLQSISSISPPRKAKGELEVYNCDWNGCSLYYDDKTDLTIHMETHQNLRPYVESGARSNGRSSIRSDSSGSTGSDACCESDYSIPSLTHGSRSSTSALSSRSSSITPTLGVEADISSGSPPTTDFEVPVEIWKATMTNEPLELCHLDVHVGAIASSNTFDKNLEDCGLLDGKSLQDGKEGVNPNLSTTTSNPSSSSSDSPSLGGTENPSTDDDGSTQSRKSTEVSDSDLCEDSADHDCNSLEVVIKTILIDDEVAGLVFLELDGKLECAPPTVNEHFDRSSLSLLDLLELQDPTPIQNGGAFTTYAASSAQSQVNFDGPGGFAEASSSGQTQGDNSVGQTPSSDNFSPGQLTKQQKTTSQPGASEASKIHLFRCIHNCLGPTIFCANHETKKKYATCAGPGWNTIHHLKGHMKTHHTTKPNPLQCNRCQEIFKNQEVLKHHDLNSDCQIRCPICKQEFDKKAMRQTHQEKQHVNENRASQYMEIDEQLDDQIQKNLKSFAESLKKGKARMDPALEQWIESNNQLYLVGRPLKANAQLELGQWYTMYSTLSSNAVVPYPFYDLGVPNSDIVTERILFINRTLVQAKIQTHGPPPMDQQQQIEWYNAVLSESLRLAANTRFIPTDTAGQTSGQALEQSSVPMDPSYSQDTNLSNMDATVYSMQRMPTQEAMVPRLQYTMAQTHPSQFPGMNNHLSSIAINPVLLSQDQPPSSLMASTSYASSHSTPAPTRPIQGIRSQPWEHYPQGVPSTSSMGQNFSHQYDAFGMQQAYTVFEESDPDLPDLDQYGQDPSMGS